jgi:hypothetical protein
LSGNVASRAVAMGGIRAVHAVQRHVHRSDARHRGDIDGYAVAAVSRAPARHHAARSPEPHRGPDPALPGNGQEHILEHEGLTFTDVVKITKYMTATRGVGVEKCRGQKKPLDRTTLVHRASRQKWAMSCRARPDARWPQSDLRTRPVLCRRGRDPACGWQLPDVQGPRSKLTQSRLRLGL